MSIIGHRGARGEAPENTLGGFRHLRLLGVRRVEFDIQVAGDGELVVIHDPDLARTTDATGRVGEKTAAELARVDAGHRVFTDWPEREGVPTLAEVLAVLHDFAHIELEVKAQSPADCAQVAARLPALWQPFEARAVTTSFNVDYLRLMQRLHPHIPRGLLVESDFQGDIVALAQALGCVSIGPHESLCTPALINAAHQAGLKVSTWTVNLPDRIRELHAQGVDGIITDYPTRALALIG